MNDLILSDSTGNSRDVEQTQGACRQVQLLAANVNEAAAIHTENALLPAETFLSEGYEFRYNVLSKKIEVRERGTETWRHMDRMAFNSIVVAARKALPDERGLKALLNDIIYSEATPLWNPATSWLFTRPKWDGLDRISWLLSLIYGITAEQAYWVHLWWRSVVAHWLQMDALHANEVVVMLIGEQGCGKSTFFLRLLPPELREYYLDHVNLTNKFDKDMALTNNLLINIDEFDQITPSQQAMLKQMVSKVRVNGRRIFASEQTDSPRYASFVATTNNRHPLRDRTGSRRFICIEVAPGHEIDNSVEIDYDQLYAQLMAELHGGQRYWFTPEEVLSIQRANVRYMSTLDLETMIETCFRQPEEGEYAEPLTTSAVMEILLREYPTLKATHSLRVQIGIAFTHLGFVCQKNKHGHLYQAIPIRRQ